MKSNTATPKKAPALKNKKIANSFPVVAIGASAGGLEAVSTLLENLPADTGMAYIFVQHLSKTHKSFLTSILSKITKMKVQEIEEMEHMKPNNVYVIPHNRGIEVTDGHIQLLDRPKNTATNLSIDILFSSLAETHKENVIGIVLSGNANDGTSGLKAIKEAGGMTFAQDDSAQASSMPHSAIATGLVDFVMSPKDIAIELTKYSQSGFKRKEIEKDIIVDDFDQNNPDFKFILEVLFKEKGVDFSHYKMATVKRRLNHRMLQSSVETIKEYAQTLLAKKNEINLLYKDLLINVTSFFREPDTFKYLKSTVFPKILKSKTVDETLRIWIPACSTGEEAYSIAMIIAELQENKTQKIAVKIFATDLSERAIRDARVGEYVLSDIQLMGSKRINRFFKKSGDAYQIVKELREMCVFAPHNVLGDPPFLKMDFIGCCNLLIYFDAVAQKKNLSTLHFALVDGGFLMLGKSEVIGISSQLFNAVNNKFKIFSSKKSLGIRKLPELSPRFASTFTAEKTSNSLTKKNSSVDALKLETTIDNILLSRYMPASVVINKDMEILQFRGATSLYLSHPSGGKASLNILKMTRPEFAFELRNAIHKAIKTKQTVEKTGIEIKIESGFQMMSLEVCPLKIEWGEPLILIVFTLQEKVEKYVEDGKHAKNNSLQKDRRIKKLTEELNSARIEMQAFIELQETAYEELQVANEEIVSTNEEFQTVNEELETSKEELEATNEELISTNQELQIRNEMLAESYSYCETVYDTIHEPLLVLDNNLVIKSANNSFYKKFHFIKEQTEGVPLFELGNKQWEIPELRVLLENILAKNSYFENFEVTHVFPKLGEKIMLMNANRIIQKTHRKKLILLAISDITEIRKISSALQKNEKKALESQIIEQKQQKSELEQAVKIRTKLLEQKNIELEAANRDLTTFNYISSHDLQEPLRKIQNFVSCLLDDDLENLNSSSKIYLDKITATTSRMQLLIDDLLAYSRISKKGSSQFEKTNIEEIVKNVIKDFAETIEEKKVIVEMKELCHATVNKFQFQQLIYNLMSNALKFSVPSVPPHIIISSKIIVGNKLDFKKLTLNKSYCHIIFSDNGIGINPEYKERIFEVFQRLNAHDEYKGTGMGLAICKRIVENHKGIITATGKPGKGLRFDIYLPVD